MTASSPSTASFKSFPTTSFETDYHTASVCKPEASSEFYRRLLSSTLEICHSEVSAEFFTAEKCRTVEMEFVAVDICECKCSMQFETASVRKTIPSEASTPQSLAVDLPSSAPTLPVKTPLVVPSIVPSRLSEFSPMHSNGSREVEPEPPSVTKVTHTEIVSPGDLSITFPSTGLPTSSGE